MGHTPVLLPVLLLSFLTVAQSKERASDVLSDFVSSHLDESAIEDIIGSDGLDHIIEHTQDWKIEDARSLIDSLTRADLAPNNILKAIWITVNFVFSTENHQEIEAASNIFFDFATSRLTASDLEKVIGDGWLDDVIKDTQEWRVEDANHLIRSLTGANIAPGDILKVTRVVVRLLQKPTVASVLETVVETEISRETTEETTKQENPVAGEKSAAEVFINFVKEHRGENFERVMGSNWVEKIIKYTPYWRAWEATEFLNYLVGLIGLDLALARIKTASYLKRIHYSSFKERLEFYSQEEYLGEEGVRRKLSQSFNGFHLGHLENIENTIKQVRDIIGGEGIKRIFSKPRVNLGAFTVVNTEITHIVNWLEEVKNGRGISRAEINKAIIRNTVAFTNGKVQTLKVIVEEIKARVKSYGLPEGETLLESEIEVRLNEAIIRDPVAFTRGNIESLRAIVDEIKTRVKSYGLPEGVTLSEAEIEAKLNEAIIKTPQSFTRGRVENLRVIVAEIKARVKSYGLPEGETLSESEIEAKLNEAIIRSSQAFTSGNIENLKAIVDEIKTRVKNYGLPEGVTLSEKKIEAKLNEMLIRNPQAFTSSKVENLRAIVTEIKARVKSYGLPEIETLSEIEIEAQLNEAIIRNPHDFTSGNVGNLRVIVAEIKIHLNTLKLTETEIEVKINEAIIRNPVVFTKLKPKGLKTMKKRFGIDGLIEALKNLSTEQLEEMIDNTSENMATQDQEEAGQDSSDGLCSSSLQ